MRAAAPSRVKRKYTKRVTSKKAQHPGEQGTREQSELCPPKSTSESKAKLQLRKQQSDKVDQITDKNVQAFD